MSNHSGSYMLNETLMGVLKLLREWEVTVSSSRRRALAHLLVEAGYSDDCNTGEILAENLGAYCGICPSCGEDSDVFIEKECPRCFRRQYREESIVTGAMEIAEDIKIDILANGFPGNKDGDDEGNSKDGDDGGNSDEGDDGLDKDAFVQLDIVVHVAGDAFEGTYYVSKEPKTYP